MRRRYTRRPRLENISLEDFESEKMRLKGLGLKVNATVHEWHFVFARCTSPTRSGVLSLSKGGIYWSLSVTMQAWDRGNAGIHSNSALTSPACFAASACDKDHEFRNTLFTTEILSVQVLAPELTQAYNLYRRNYPTNGGRVRHVFD